MKNALSFPVAVGFLVRAEIICIAANVFLLHGGKLLGVCLLCGIKASVCLVGKKTRVAAALQAAFKKLLCGFSVGRRTFCA